MTCQLRANLRRDDGVTLTELLIVLLVSSIIAVLTTTLVIGVQETNKQNMVRQDQIDNGRTASEAMARTLRASVKPSQLSTSCGSGCVADAFMQATKFRVQFYANVDNPQNSIGPSRVTYTIVDSGVDKGDLIETVQIPNSPTPSASGYVYCTPGGAGCASRITTRIVGRNLSTTGPALFRYFDESGNEMVPSGTGSLSADQLKHVLSIEIRTTVLDTASGSSKPTTYIQRVMAPNAQAVIKAGSE